MNLRSRVAVAVLALVALTVFGINVGALGTDRGVPTAPTQSGDTAVTPTADEWRTTLAMLERLDVKGRAPKTGYDRELFGPRWADTDRNGCDTRNDTLRRDLTGLELKPGTHGCVVLAGVLTDPYSGRAIDFRRGPTTSLEVQIDHVVPLFDAWQKGAQQWPVAQRVAFANDPDNLLAVDGDLNEQKGSGDAATWQPPDRSFRCTYATIQVRVKAKYGLWVTAAEKAALARMLELCPTP